MRDELVNVLLSVHITVFESRALSVGLPLTNHMRKENG